jgi:zinc protease
MSTPMRIQTMLLVLGAGLVLAAPAAAQQTPPEPGTPRPFTVPPARDFTLANGLRVTFVQYGTIPKATVRLVSRVGNLHETSEQVWLADFVGDLMQEGTTTRTAAQLAAETARMGGGLSVSVGANETWAGGEVLGEFAPEMVALVADVVRNPLFPESELPRIKANRARQIAVSRTQPQPLAVERFRQAMYPGHRFGTTYPAPEAVQSYTVDQIRDFHGASFGAARATLYVVGRFDEAATEAAVRRAFGDWHPGPAPVPVALSPTSARVVHLIHRPGAVQSTIYLGLPVVNPSHPDWVAFDVMNALLGGAFASRITANIREDKGYTYSPYSTVSVRQGDAYWAQAADVTTPVTGASLHEIFYEIERLRDAPPTAAELRGIQNYLAGTFVLQNSSRGGIIGQLAYMRLHGLPAEHLQTYVSRVHAVTPEEVSRIARTYLDPARMTIVVVGDREQIEEQLRPYGEIRVD